LTRLASDDSLLVRLPSWLGDWVMAEPTVASLAGALRRGRFRALSLAGPERFFELFENRFEGVRRLSEGDDWSGHDMALFLDGSSRSVMRAVRAGISERWSWSTGVRGLLATAGFRPALERGAAALHVGRKGRGLRRLPRPFGAACAELCGALGVPVTARAPLLAPTSRGEEAATSRLASLGLSEGDPYFALDISARPVSAKGVPAELWSAVLELLAERGAPPVLLLTAPGEDEAAPSLRGKGGALVTDPPPSLAELLALISSSTLFLGPDSGPRHLAVATSRPIVTLFGPTDPRHTADHLELTTALRLELECAPCHLEVCPLSSAEHGVCFSGIDPELVVAATGYPLDDHE
jgi:heptosyltransferase II